MMNAGDWIDAAQHHVRQAIKDIEKCETRQGSVNTPPEVKDAYVRLLAAVSELNEARAML